MKLFYDRNAFGTNGSDIRTKGYHITQFIYRLIDERKEYYERTVDRKSTHPNEYFAMAKSAGLLDEKGNCVKRDNETCCANIRTLAERWKIPYNSAERLFGKLRLHFFDSATLHGMYQAGSFPEHVPAETTAELMALMDVLTRPVPGSVLHDCETYANERMLGDRMEQIEEMANYPVSGAIRIKNGKRNDSGKISREILNCRLEEMAIDF